LAVHWLRLPSPNPDTIVIAPFENCERFSFSRLLVGVIARPIDHPIEPPKIQASTWRTGCEGAVAAAQRQTANAVQPIT